MVIGVGLQGREQDGGDVINLVALGLFYGLLVFAVSADARDLPLVRAVRLLVPRGFRDVKSVVFVAIGVFVIGSVNRVFYHLTVLPDGGAVDLDGDKLIPFWIRRILLDGEPP